MKHPSLLVVLGIVTSSLTLSLGCAKERPAINRVQPDGYKKSFFVGEDLKSVADDPEFYSQGTLVDVGYGAAQDGLFTSTYAQPLTRVKWTVTEKMLIARLAYERIQGTDGKGVGKATNDGIVVAAFTIDKHFDVRRSYNAATGEQSNVLEENDRDRPWSEREYMRVDWSKNLSTDNYDFDTLSMLGVFGGVRYEPVAYYVNDPTSDDAPRFDEATGYLDVTNKAFAKPQGIDLSIFGMGFMPACMFGVNVSFGTAPAGQCSPVELTIRQAFRKVVPTDYEPADWDGHRFQAYGAFTTERRGYARNYGMTDTQLHRFINRYNLWERSHFYTDPQAMTGPVECFTPATTPAGVDPNRDTDANGTADECERVGGGSQCDPFSQRCTLPYSRRIPRPLAWHVTNESNLEYFDATRDAAHEWDVALRSSVMTARYAECQRTGGAQAECQEKYPVYHGQQDENDDAVWLAREVDDCRERRAHAGRDCNALAEVLGVERGFSAGVIELAKMPEMIVLCHSPVEAGDPPACAPQEERLPQGWTAARCQAGRKAGDAEAVRVCSEALNVRAGDLRYHRIATIATPQTPSPWGIMVDSNDPLTGEVVSASVNVWSHVTDLAAQGLVDTSRYIKGELKTEQVTEGTYVRDWASAARALSSGTAPKMSLAERDAQIARALGKTPQQLESIRKSLSGNAALQKKLQALRQEVRDIRADAMAPSTSQPIAEARRKRALNSPTEAALLTPMMQAFAGSPKQLPAEAVLALASPLRLSNPSTEREIRQRRELALAERGACMLHESPAPLATADLADILEQKFGTFDGTQSVADQLARADKMKKYVAQKMHFAVMAHEMGHSIGLRHNFVSSSDAFNYRAQYWALRTDGGKNEKSCNGRVVANGSCVGPRYLDPLNDNERANLLPMFMHSSVMDYPGELTQDMIALGAYDFAATRMFYGDVAPVFADESYKAGTPRGVGALDKLDNFGGILGFKPSIGKGDAADPTDTDDIHYSAYQQNFALIPSCVEVEPAQFKPSSWNTEVHGEWHPLLDGLIVSVDGKPTRCRQQPVDYVSWKTLRAAAATESTNTRAGPSVDSAARVRVPYGFATDRWADLGNLAVYRHDNGADPYELFDFLITQQEVSHIFDNYRRNRQTFSVRAAAMRTLGRYNEKLRDAAKGLGLINNIYRDLAEAISYDFDSLWVYLVAVQFGENYLASGIGFDHFARQLARPEAGPHDLMMIGDAGVAMSTADVVKTPGETVLVVPNGATGFYGDVTYGGRLIENQLAEDKGEYNAEYTVNAGSYYDKLFTAYLLTESQDNFISDSRRDFLDARYRSVSMADLFPEGYRRWLGNNLTGDVLRKGPRVVLGDNGSPELDAEKYPVYGMGWIQWWADEPVPCYQLSSIRCVGVDVPAYVVDPQVGWEQQKFLIAFTLMYLPENQKQTWLNQLGIWELGADADPGFGGRKELHLPDGKVYIAKTFGRELVLGKEVEKGIAARMLEWGNELLAKAYDTTPVDFDSDGKVDWYRPTLTNGRPRVKYDPSFTFLDLERGVESSTKAGCSPEDNSACTCANNLACMELSRYEQVPAFMRQAMRDFGMADPSMRGIY